MQGGATVKTPLGVVAIGAICFVLGLAAGIPIVSRMDDSAFTQLEQANQGNVESLKACTAKTIESRDTIEHQNQELTKMYQAPECIRAIGEAGTPSRKP
jgi:hypothetical protein